MLDDIKENGYQKLRRDAAKPAWIEDSKEESSSPKDFINKISGFLKKKTLKQKKIIESHRQKRNREELINISLDLSEISSSQNGTNQNFTAIHLH